jgi:hypothetical protein
MLIVVIVFQALRGRLPTEISGRGVRYADAETAGAAQANAERVGRRHDFEIAQLRGVVMRLEKRHAELAKEID